MYRATNLATSPPWELIGSNIARSATGINVWYDSSPPDLPTYYRPSLPTNTP